MKRTEFDKLKEMTTAQLISEKNKIAKEAVLERAKLAKEGKKNSPLIRSKRKSIAWVETLINEKIGTEISKEEKNGK